MHQTTPVSWIKPNDVLVSRTVPFFSVFQYNFLIRNLFQPSGIISVCEIGDSSKGVVAAPGMTDKGDNSHSDNAMALTGLS